MDFMSWRIFDIFLKIWTQILRVVDNVFMPDAESISWQRRGGLLIHRLLEVAS